MLVTLLGYSQIYLFRKNSPSTMSTTTRGHLLLNPYDRTPIKAKSMPIDSHEPVYIPSTKACYTDTQRFLSTSIKTILIKQHNASVLFLQNQRPRIFTLYHNQK